MGVGREREHRFGLLFASGRFSVVNIGSVLRPVLGESITEFGTEEIDVRRSLVDGRVAVSNILGICVFSFQQKRLNAPFDRDERCFDDHGVVAVLFP